MSGEDQLGGEKTVGVGDQHQGDDNAEVVRDKQKVQLAGRVSELGVVHRDRGEEVHKLQDGEQ